MNLMSRLFPPARQRLRLRSARAAIRRADRAIARRQRAAMPGYDELRDPVFLSVMTLAVVVLVADLLAEADTSVLVSWDVAAIDALRSWS